ncbi:MAG TPA: hypothetical protein PL129_01525, partial [bacterium]|nr:hypothetical protein [bacterium]
NVDDQKYAMLGLNFTKYDVDLGTSDKSKSSIGAMAGAGYRYKLTDKISANAEGKYRLITLDAGNGVKLTGAWYSVGVGFSYALN